MRIIDLTDEITLAKKTNMKDTYNLFWEEEIDFKQYRLDYDLAEYLGGYFYINKYGLGEEYKGEI